VCLGHRTGRRLSDIPAEGEITDYETPLDGTAYKSVAMLAENDWKQLRIRAARPCITLSMSVTSPGRKNSIDTGKRNDAGGDDDMAKEVPKVIRAGLELLLLEKSVMKKLSPVISRVAPAIQQGQ
jgi:hypothetical protein